MDPKLFSLILKIIILAPKKFRRLTFCIWEIFYAKFQRSFLSALTLSIFELEKRFFKQVRILPEIDWYHYQSANAAPMAKVRDRIKTDLFRQSHIRAHCGGWHICKQYLYCYEEGGWVVRWWNTFEWYQNSYQPAKSIQSCAMYPES